MRPTDVECKVWPESHLSCLSPERGREPRRERDWFPMTGKHDSSHLSWFPQTRNRQDLLKLCGVNAREPRTMRNTLQLNKLRSFLTATRESAHNVNCEVSQSEGVTEDLLLDAFVLGDFEEASGSRALLWIGCCEEGGLIL